MLVPGTPRENTAHVYFGTRVNDPYQWLEQKHAPRTKAWVAHQVSLTERMFDHLADRAQMQHVVLDLLNPRSDGLPQHGGSVIAFERSHGAGRRPVIVASTSGTERVLLDPNTRWTDGSTSIADWRLAPDGRNVAYATKHGGSGFVHWHVLEVRTGHNRDDDVVGTPDWAPISWARNGSGFYYGGYPAEKMTAGSAIGTGYSVRFHRVNAKQSSDAVVYARQDHPTWLPYVQESNRGDYLVIEAIEGSGDGNFVAVRKLRSNAMPLVLRPMSGSYYRYVDNTGSRFYFTTDAAATRGRLVAIDASSPDGERDVIAQTGNTLQDVSSAGGRFIARYLRDVRSEVSIFTYAGKWVGTLPLPDPATVTDVVADTARLVAYYQYSSPTTPPTISAYDVRTNDVRTMSRVKAPFDSSAYVTEELFARSADGTRVPVFVAHRRHQRGLLPPTLLTGYGGFGDSYLPKWSTLGAAWLSRGGTFAIACVRGGGEYGERWHRAGMLGNKQHVFDDFAASARLLIARRFATPSSLGIYGYSGGGLLTGTSEVQHPELYGAAVEAAGPVDVLRGYTYGFESAWTGEVGTPVASRELFDGSTPTRRSSISGQIVITPRRWL